MRTKWQALLDESMAVQALAVARSIGVAPRTAASLAPANPSLAGGFSGVALWLAYADRCGVCQATTRRRALLARADDCLESDTLPPGLHTGFTGIAWMHAHLSHVYDDPDDTDVSAIDDALIETLEMPWTRDYDLIDGLVGLGVYALERLPAPSGARLLDLVVEQLQDQAVEVAEGVTWFTPASLAPLPPSGEPHRGHFNLGVAHGVPGVVGLLAAAAAAGHAPARQLLGQAVPWLVAQELPADAEASFGAWIDEDGTCLGPTRLAWCYGDAGVAAVLMMAAQSAGRADWRHAALRVARRAATRTFESSGVRDATFCHGAAGLAHIFNRLWQTTGEAWLAEAARAWIARTLEYRRPHSGIGGYQRWELDADRQESWHTDAGVLTGSAGVGLVLLAAATNVEPEWDRAFLLSGRTAMADTTTRDAWRVGAL